MTVNASERPAALVSPEWVAARANDPNLCLVEVAGLRPEDVQAYHAGHVPGAHSWKWQEMLWDSQMRDFPSPEAFARRMGDAGIDNDTTVVFYGEGVQFGIYAWWVFTYCGHERVHLLDGALDPLGRGGSTARERRAAAAPAARLPPASACRAHAHSAR